MMSNNENAKKNEIEKIDIDQTAKVAGGRDGFFHNWNIMKTFCDNCDRVIDGDKIVGVTLNDGRVFCDVCVTKYRNLLGREAFERKYLSSSSNSVPNKGTEAHK